MTDIIGTINHYWPNTAIRYAATEDAFPNGSTPTACMGGFVELVDGATLPADADITAQLSNYDTYVSGLATAAQTKAAISAALTESDKTMLRIQEAVTLGFTTWTTADVVTWVQYRRALRNGTLGTKPAYPANT